MKIINYQVEMLDVADADAFIVYYITDDNKKHLVMIDAGRHGNGEKIVKHLHTYYSGIPVELAIVTHPDDDHYGGFVYMLQLMESKAENAVTINKFWINDPRNHINVADVEEDIQKKTLEKRLADIYVADGVSLLSLIEKLKIPYKEAFAEKEKVYRNMDDWHLISKWVCKESSQVGFTILGPTIDYFKSVCQDFRYEHVNVTERAEKDDPVDSEDFKDTDVCLSKVLDEAGDDGSDHNRSSIIVLFQPADGKKYLFTGDASVPSFENMTNIHKNLCKDIHWLKVPHHGSMYNLNSAWILHFKPKVAYISTARIGKFLNQCVVNALKKVNADVYCSHKNHGGLLNNSFQNRFGWSSKYVTKS